MRVLVTGAAGFIGSHVVAHLLSQGHEPIALARGRKQSSCHWAPKVRSVVGDARDSTLVGEAARDCEAIIHCAAIVGTNHYSRQPVETMQTEVQTLEAVCQAARGASDCKVIYASSSAVYGASERPPLKEDLTAVGASAYAISKRFGELYLAAQHREYGLESASLRIFNVYGPGQDSRLVIPNFIERAMAGQPLSVFGTGSSQRDFVYVDDVVRVMVDAIWKTTGCDVVNVASGIPTSVHDIASLIVNRTASRSRILTQPIPGSRREFEVDLSYGSTEKLRKLMGYVPETDLENGIGFTIDSYADS